MIRKPIQIECVCCVGEEDRARNTALAPDLPPPTGHGHLAVVGGGPSVRQHVEALRNWDGDVWGINSAAVWCRENGIDAALVAVDPEDVFQEMTDGITRAVLAPHCPQSRYQSLLANGAAVAKTDCELPGPTTAVAVTTIAINAGYSRVTFFGCESSYGTDTHVYEVPLHEHLLRIVCGGKAYMTKPELLRQAEQLAEAISTFPLIFAEESGGLLRAIIHNGYRYQISHVTRALYATLEWKDEAA